MSLLVDAPRPEEEKKMYLEPRPFRHVEWIVDRPAPEYDLAWSNISPDWSDHIDLRVDTGDITSPPPRGKLELIEHLAESYEVDPSRVIITNGCSEANTLALMSSLKKGDKVLVEKPIYTPLLELPRALGCNVSTIKRRPDAYGFDVSELDERLSGGIDLFVMQNLSNPTGRGLFGPQLKDIKRILERYKVPVLVDEVYRDYTLNFRAGSPARPALPSMVSIYERAMITSSVTKVYGAGGLMTGWLIGPKRIVNRARRIKVHTVPMVSHSGNSMALGILRKREKVLPGHFDELRSKLNLISAWAAGRNDVHWSEPDGCSVGFLRYDHDIPSKELCERLYNEGSVRVIPGEFFRMERGFRIGAAAPYEKLKGGLERIDSMLDSLDD